MSKKCKIIIVVSFIFGINSIGFPVNAQTDDILQKVDQCRRESRILTPADRQSGVGHPLRVEGRAIDCPYNYHLWLVVHPLTSLGYWPQGGKLSISPRDGSWEANAFLGEDRRGIGERYHIILILANDSANQYYLKYLKATPTKGYPAVSLPKGTYLIDRITYTRTE